MAASILNERAGMTARTREPQYDAAVAIAEQGVTRLGVMTNQVWHDDPKRLVFVLSRYKFVTKLMAGRQNVLEIGCADAFGTRIVRQAVPKVTATDIDPIFIEDCRARDEGDGPWPMQYALHDIVQGPFHGPFDVPVAHATPAPVGTSSK